LLLLLLAFIIYKLLYTSTIKVLQSVTLFLCFLCCLS
jgi:hypothetical protein